MRAADVNGYSTPDFLKLDKGFISVNVSKWTVILHFSIINISCLVLWHCAGQYDLHTHSFICTTESPFESRCGCECSLLSEILNVVYQRSAEIPLV